MRSARCALRHSKRHKQQPDICGQRGAGCAKALMWSNVRAICGQRSAERARGANVESQRGYLRSAWLCRLCQAVPRKRQLAVAAAAATATEEYYNFDLLIAIHSTMGSASGSRGPAVRAQAPPSKSVYHSGHTFYISKAYTQGSFQSRIGNGPGQHPSRVNKPRVNKPPPSPLVSPRMCQARASCARLCQAVPG